MGLSLSRITRRRRRRNQENDQDHHHNQQPQSLPFRLQYSSFPPPPPSSSSSSSSSSYSSPPPLPFRSTASSSSPFVILAPPPPPGLSSTLPPLSPIRLPRPPPSSPPPPPPLPPPPPPPPHPPSPPRLVLNLQLRPPPPPPPFPMVDFLHSGTLPPPSPFYWDCDLWDLQTTTPSSSSSSPSSPPSPPPTYFYAVNSVPISSVASDSRNYSQPMLLLANPRNGLDGDHSLMMSTSHPQPPCVSAKKINNDVVVHKDTIKLVMDTKDFGNYLVSFTFDALVDGSITVLFFAKEEGNCTFLPLYPECCLPRKFPYQKGLSQKFFQPSGTGIDLGFFDIDELSSFQPAEGIFPLVICVETCLLPLSVDAQSIQPLRTKSADAQVTQAVLEKNNEGQFQVRVIEQILWVDGVSYELLELYGIGFSGEAGADDNEPGKECVICMTKPKDTTVLPCRHMCMCSDCAEALRTRSNKCPICRQLIDQLVVMKVDKALS